MIVWLRHFLGWVVGAFRSREDIILENLALRQQLLALHAQRPRRRLTASHKLFWVVLRRCWARWKEPLIQVDTQNRCRLASCRLSAVLEMAFKSQVEGRSQAGEQTDSSLNFSNGCGKSNLGSAPHSWRATQARLRSIRTNGFALGAASPKTSRSRQALADFSSQSSRGDRSDGLLHCADTDLRHSVLLLRDRPRPASDPALQRDSQSQRALGCPAVARDLGIQPTAAALPDLRSGRQVQCRCGLDREGDGQPTDSLRIPQSLAERNCRALGWQCTSRSPGSCDRAESETSATVAE